MIRVQKVVEALERARRDSADDDDVTLLAEYICGLLLQLYNTTSDKHSRAAYASALKALQRVMRGGDR